MASGPEPQDAYLVAPAGCAERYVVAHHELIATEGATDALLTAAVDADLLVVGTRGRGILRSTPLGSVSHAVAHHAAIVR